MDPRRFNKIRDCADAAEVFLKAARKALRSPDTADEQAALAGLQKAHEFVEEALDAPR